MQWDLIVECLVPTLKLIFYWGREPCTLCPSNPSLRGFTVHSLYIWALQFVYLTAKTTFLPKSLQWARNSKKWGAFRWLPKFSMHQKDHQIPSDNS